MQSLIRGTARAAIVFGAVGVSTYNGVWSTNAEEGAQQYSRLKSHVLPGTIIYREELPSTSEARHSMISGWNRVVNCAFASTASATQWVKAKSHEWANQIDISFLNQEDKQ